MKTERELYEDWKPLLDAQQDALVTYDEELELEETYIEQTNGPRGSTAGGPTDPGHGNAIRQRAWWDSACATQIRAAIS
jgi:hypothetical protein